MFEPYIGKNYGIVQFDQDSSHVLVMSDGTLGSCLIEKQKAILGCFALLAAVFTPTPISCAFTLIGSVCLWQSTKKYNGSVVGNIQSVWSFTFHGFNDWFNRL